MQIDNIQAKIRPRGNWEAIDLGFLMANRWKSHIYKTWFLVTFPIFMLLNLIFYNNMGWVCFIFWLLKPVFDRFILITVSRRLFKEKIVNSELIKLAPRLFFKHIIKHLTIYRFDPNRAFNLPVWFLENLSGKRRSERARILKLTASGASSLLTFAALHLELFFYVAIIALIASIFPNYMLFGDMFRNSFENIIALYESNNWYIDFFANSIYFLSVTLIEPFYVCAGFTLYLNRRTELESWDIELDFKKMRQRLEDKQKRYNLGAFKIALISMLCVGILSFFPIENSYAATPNSNVLRNESCDKWNKKLTAAPTNDAEKVIRSILSQDKYKKCSINTKFEPKPQEKSSGDNNLLKKFWKWIFEKFGGKSEPSNSDDISFANIIELFFWGLGGLIVCFLLYQLHKYREYFLNIIKPVENDKKKIPSEIFGLDITPRSIPDLLSDEVLKLWNEGEFMQAISLLYRGYLSKLTHEFNVDIKISYTENDCLLAAKQAISNKNEALQLFTQISQIWLKSAYAHQLPSKDEVIDCCRAWRLQFEPANPRFIDD